MSAVAWSRQMWGRREDEKVRPRVRELVLFLAEARARGVWIMAKQGGGRGEAAGEEAVEEAGEAGRGTQVVRAAAGQQRGTVERAAGSGRRQMETRKEAAGGGKRARWGKPGQCEHKRQRSKCRECGGASICQYLSVPSGKEQVQGVRRVKHLPAPSAKERVQGVRRGGICQHHRRTRAPDVERLHSHM